MFDYAEPTVLLAINAAVAYNEDAGSLHNPKIANACVEQRDDIVTMIAAAEDAESLYAVERILRFASNLWHAVGYGYKASELRLRIKARAELLYSVNMNFLAGERKNSKVRRGVESDNKRLKAIAQIA